jgi:hypothetical protein
MKNVFFVLCLLFLNLTGYAQLNLFTHPPLNGGNGLAGTAAGTGVTFNVRALSSVFIDTIYIPTYGTLGNASTAQIWVGPAITAQPSISAPTWNQIQPSFPVTVVNAGSTAPAGGFNWSPVVIPGGLLVNAGDVVGIFVGLTPGSSIAYTGSGAIPAGQDTFTNGIVTIYTGVGVGWGGNLPSPSITVRQFTGGISLRVASGRDARITGLISPVTLSVGNNTLTARVQNAAADAITQVDFGYQVNNDAPILNPAISIAPALNPGQVFDHTFTAPLNIQANGTYQVKVWATNANGLGADNNTTNDTLIANLCTGLAGNYTVGGASAQYPTIEAAVADLNQCGISAAVSFLINPGTYIGSYTIGNFVNPGNFTVTFASANNIAVDVVLIHDTAAATSTVRSHFVVNSTSRIAFHRLTLRRTINPTTAGQGILVFSNPAGSGQVIGCTIEEQVLSTSTFNNGIIYRGSNGLFSSNTFSGFYYAIFLDGPASNTFSGTNNVMGNAFANYVYRAVYALNQSGSVISGNQFTGFVGTSTIGAAIWTVNNINTRVSANNISGAMSGNGIVITNPNADTLVPANVNRVFNNVINGFQSNTLTVTTLAITPINLSGSFSTAVTTPMNPRDAIEIVNNTVVYTVSTTSTSTIQAGIYVAGGTSTVPAWSRIVMRNNHFEVHPGSGNLPASFRLVRFSNQTQVDSLQSSNNNYIFGGSAVPAMFRVNSPVLDFLTLSDWQTATAQDNLSLNVLPNFLSPTLLVPTNLALDNKGIPISYVDNDITGAARNATTPDIGAYEFTGATFSSIAFTALGDTTVGAIRTFTATITDSLSGITAGSPRIFYRKGLLGSWAMSLSTGNSGSSYAFQIDYNDIGGVMGGDTVYYYLAVQNGAGVVTTMPLGGLGLLAGSATVPPTLFSYRIMLSLTGTYTIGVSALSDFSTITAAANQYNQSFIAGAVNFVLIDTLYSTNESFPIVFNDRPGTSATNEIKLFPSPNISGARITGTSLTGNALLVLNGAKHFVIDGSKNGTNSRDLSIENNGTAANTAAIHLRSTATNNLAHIVVKNTRLIGSSSTITTAFGLLASGQLISTSSVSEGLSHLQILNNQVERASFGIDAKGSILSPMQEILVRENEIGSTDTSSMVVLRAIQLQNVNGSQVLRNTIRSMYSATAATQTAIEISGTNNNDVAIEHNRIQGVVNKNTGGWGAYGININAGSAMRLVNNEITNISTLNYSATSTTWNAIGIRLNNNVSAEVYYNSVNMFGDYTNVSAAGAAAAAFCVVGQSVSGIVQNNIFNVNYNSISTGPKLFAAVWMPATYDYNALQFNNNAYHVADNGEHMVGRAGIVANSGFFNDLTSWRTVTSAVNFNNDVQSIPFIGKSLAPFISNTNLAIAAGTNTYAESGGVYISNLGPINYDINSIARPAFNGTAPDMGAYEFDGIRPTAVLPMQIDSVHIDVPSGQCYLAARTVTIRLSSGTAVVSGAVGRSINGVQQSNIAMSLTSGTNLIGIWSAIVPAVNNTGDILSLSVSFVDSLGDTLAATLGDFIDQEINVNAGADQIINRGDVTTLTASMNSGQVGASGKVVTLNSGGNGANGITFNVTALTALRIDTLFVSLYSGSQGVVNVWRRNTGINGAPTIDSANGWSPVILSYPIQIFNTSTAGPLQFSAIPIPGGIDMVAGQTFGFYIGSTMGSVAYTTYLTTIPDVYSDGAMSIATGPNVGYGGGFPNPLNHPRMFNGSIAYSIPAATVVWTELTAPGTAVRQFGSDTTTNTTTTYPAPYGNWYWGAKHQMLITAAELFAQGFMAGSQISALYFDVAAAQGVGLQNFSISMGHSAASVLSSVQTGLQPVYDANSYTDTIGWNRHAFHTNFTWDGASSIVIETCFNNSNFTFNSRVKHTNTGFNSTLYYFNDATGVCNINSNFISNSLRPNMLLELGGVIIGIGNSIQVAPLTTTTYRATAINNQCFASDEVEVQVVQPNNQVGGTVRYFNSNSTALNNVDVYLIDANNNVILDVQPVSAGGQFNFTGLSNGNYRLAPFTLRPWGGVNATDALAVSNHFISALQLQPLPLMAADVNGSNAVNSTDALVLARRFVGLSSGFAVGDWVFDNPLVVASGNAQVNLDVFGLCYGDVNGSFQPGTNRLVPQLALERKGVLSIGSEVVQVPVRIDRSLELGALSVVMQLPTGLVLADVQSALPRGQFDFKLTGEELRISWFSTQAVDLKANEELFFLEVSAAQNWPEDIQITGLSEAASGLAVAYPMVNLRLPRLQSALAGVFTANIYPNPANEQAILSYQLPENGAMTLRITDALGRTVWQLDESEQLAGQHQITLASSELAAGTYHVQLIYAANGQQELKQLKLQVVR